MSDLRGKEQGVGQVFIVVGILILLVAIGVVVWRTTKKTTLNNTSSTTQSPNNTAASSVSESSACIKAYNDNALCAFAEHQDISNLAYEATGTATTSATSAKSTFTVENDGKGNTEVTYGSNGQQISSISLDGNTYIQTGSGGTWLEYTGNSLGTATTVPNPTSGFDLNFTDTTPAGVKVTKVGTASCGSLTCYQYKVVVDTEPTTTNYVYFDTKDYLLRQWTSNDSSTGVAVDLTFSYPTITITKPSPVQQIST